MAHFRQEVRHNGGVLPEWQALQFFIADNVVGAAVVLLALLGAALTAHARNQIKAATTWALAPIAGNLPWNRGPGRVGPNLSSLFTLVQVFLLDEDGTRARYQKTSLFYVNRTTHSYQEAVTAEHAATAFSAMRGTISETTIERGFYVSRIDLGNPAGEGESFTNIFSADLHHSFGKPHEHWTQEFAYPTKRFTLLIHFPPSRPPKSVTCKIIDGAAERPARHNARLDDLYGRRSIVWDVVDPKPNEALKLEWSW